MQILLVVVFIAFVALGVPISFALGFVSFAQKHWSCIPKEEIMYLW